uniref:RNA polymerase sigma factor 70 region 4 type 2 domain-containing protein n=1 Tax=Streptomyces sp. NBC_00119 TaxID=2975659 RepID=A0AAU1UMK1_9ACTN
MSITLPVEYRAFYQLHEGPYLRYTQERLNDQGASRQVVETTFGNLATIWPTVISSSRPAAVAWRLLDALIASALRARQVRGCDMVHRALPHPQADVVILRCRLQLSEDQTADLLGVEKPTVASRLRMAQRILPELENCSASPSSAGVRR